VGVTVAVTLGDPRGIGPETVARALQLELPPGHPHTTLRLIGPEVEGLPHQADRERFRDLGSVTSLDVVYESVGSFDGSETSAGRVSGLAITRAAQLCLGGEAQAMVTGPIHKPALHAAGWRVPGHTELLQELSGSGAVGMLMDAERTDLGGPLRVLLVTTHIPLRAVPNRVTEGLLVQQGRLLDSELRRSWGMDQPRLALCALNPHASDSGMFGHEEAEVLEPALERLRRDGVEIRGPVPADTVFRRAVQGEFDAVMAPYHDVGMAAFKTVSFGTGVNVTLGLPFVRTSPDHGTAFDIAGQNRANPASTREAMALAIELANRRRGRADQSTADKRPS
jgi:4-hydroxythreonine-4-phosphate dehydrogenase